MVRALGCSAEGQRLDLTQAKTAKLTANPTVNGYLPDYYRGSLRQRKERIGL